MAWFPGAIRKVVERHKTAMAEYRGVCLHIAVSEGASLFNYFNQPGNPTSHFYVRYDGTVEQYVDTRYRAPAQLEGNPSMIGIETMGGVQSGQKWTAEQVESLAHLCAWCAQVHNIPLHPMTSSRPIANGIGYHRLGVDPYRVNGGERWSTAYGKTCPETQRIDQIPGIITRAQDIAGGDVPLTPQEITDIANAVWNRLIGDLPASTYLVRLDPGPDGLSASLRDDPWTKTVTDQVTGQTFNLADMIRWTRTDSRNAAVTLAAGGEVKTQLDRIETAIANLDLPEAVMVDVVAAVKQALREGTGV